ncbi:MAG TPA: hypothetical protein VKA87_08920 [Nitrososphaeraceae archaeon]|nr:hypothetical protein [Nitrososphaeraceae archaeon]
MRRRQYSNDRTINYNIMEDVPNQLQYHGRCTKDIETPIQP